MRASPKCSRLTNWAGRSNSVIYKPEKQLPPAAPAYRAAGGALYAFVQPAILFRRNPLPLHPVQFTDDFNLLFVVQTNVHIFLYDRQSDGKRYITPGKNAKPDVYNPLKEVPNIVLDALNVGMLMMGRKPEAEVEKAIMEFVTRYGLLGLMTALPTTPSFMDYEAVYLPKNHFIKEESMVTDKYLSLFYPFDQLDLVKKGIESTWNVSGDRTMVALTMTFMDEPMAKNMSFQREYAEPYDWVAQQFKDWAFTLSTSILYTSLPRLVYAAISENKKIPQSSSPLQDELCGIFCYAEHEGDQSKRVPELPPLFHSILRSHHFLKYRVQHHMP